MSEELTTAQQEENANSRTFTQAELDAIVTNRLQREREKYTDYESLKEKALKFDEAEEASKTELEKVTERAKELQAQLENVFNQNKIRDTREKVSKEKGIPVELLYGEDEETCMAQAEALLQFKGNQVGIVDKGEIAKGGVKTTTADKFAEFFSESLGK